MSACHKAPHYVIISTCYLVRPCSQTSSAYLCSSLSLRHQVSHPYKTTGKIVVLYILIFLFWYSKLEGKESAPNYSKHFLTSVCS